MGNPGTSRGRIDVGHGPDGRYQVHRAPSQTWGVHCQQRYKHPIGVYCTGSCGMLHERERTDGPCSCLYPLWLAGRATEHGTALARDSPLRGDWDGAVAMLDDISKNDAFLDFAERHGLEPIVIAKPSGEGIHTPGGSTSPDLEPHARWVLGAAGSDGSGLASGDACCPWGVTAASENLQASHPGAQARWLRSGSMPRGTRGAARRGRAAARPECARPAQTQ